MFKTDSRHGEDGSELCVCVFTGKRKPSVRSTMPDTKMDVRFVLYANANVFCVETPNRGEAS